jgi:hypothetical protein
MDTITLTLAGIISALWAFMFGYTMTRIKKVEDKQDFIDTSNTSIQTQLSQIQTDILWIKQTLSNK